MATTRVIRLSWSVRCRSTRPRTSRSRISREANAGDHVEAFGELADRQRLVHHPEDLDERLVRKGVEAVVPGRVLDDPDHLADHVPRRGDRLDIGLLVGDPVLATLHPGRERDLGLVHVRPSAAH
ncbi:hypothetical protein AB0H83_32465 [Dactylosporangium sp. NPDC050688]|uniref:hypothetical protein n=1 Tax=Dactylosporangium sp. NPDC050688 TaxID=3157217 RepID=UPI0034041BC3